MPEKAKAPAIRFKGFTDDWEQRKLGELSDSFEYGLNAAAMEYDGENKYIRITDIDNESRRFVETDLTSPKIDLSNAENYKLKIGDILFARTGASVGKSYIYKESDGLVYYAGFLIRARMKPNYDAEFVFQRTLTSRYNDYIRINSQRSGQPGVNAQEYAEFSFQVPDSEEQFKIGIFFRNFDELISLHQRKLLKLINIKRAMLEKMFPKNGSNVPEIRFAGFTDAWVQRKLGDVSEIMAGGTPSTQIDSYWMPKEIPWLSSGEVHKKSITYTDNMISKNGLENSSARWIKENSVLIALAGQGKTRGTVAINRIPLTTNQSIAAIILNKELHYEFVFQNLENRYDELRTLSSADGSRGGLNKQILSELNIRTPQFEEQQKIGLFFKNLDNLITLHQRKYEKLQNLKKACLEKMFV